MLHERITDWYDLDLRIPHWITSMCKTTAPTSEMTKNELDEHADSATTTKVGVCPGFSRKDTYKPSNPDWKSVHYRRYVCNDGELATWGNQLLHHNG